MRSSAAILLALPALLALATACGAPQAPQRAPMTAPQPPAAQALLPGQVVVLPLLGADHLRSHAWDVPRLVRIVESLGPDVVVLDATAEQVALCETQAPRQTSATLVEPSPALVDLIDLRPELPTLVALTHRLDAALVASGVYNDQARAARDEWFRQNPFGPGSRSYMAARAAWQAAWLGRDAANDPAFLLSDEYASISGNASRWLSYFAETELGPAGELRGLAHETNIAEDAIAAAPDARIVVLTAHERRYYIEGALRARFGSRVVPAAELLLP